MSYNVSGNNMLQWFYPTSAPSIAPNNAATTNFKINNIDISNNYVKIGTNSNIQVSQLYTINYFSGGQSIGNLFELNLPIFFTGALNVNYKIWPPNNNNGLLIQFLESDINNPIVFGFRYKVNCEFIIVGGGGGGGNQANDGNAGGGGGAGEVIVGNIAGYDPQFSNFTIVIGNGGGAQSNGGNTRITYFGIELTANGGGHGGNGKGDGANTTGSSAGGSGSYSAGVPVPGTSTPRTISNISIFQSMTSYGNSGALGNDQNNDSGAGGGGGGASAAASYPGNENPGVGGTGLTITYGTTTFQLGGGGGGGGRGTHDGEGKGSPIGGAGGIGGGGDGGGRDTQLNGYPGTQNTGGGGGGACNDGGVGGNGGSGTVILYILPSGVSI